MADKKKPTVTTVTIPKQKTISGNSADHLDEKANEWLRDFAITKKQQPMLGKAGSHNSNGMTEYYVVYYWFENEELSAEEKKD